MIITILAEPRSGSSSLAGWFGFQKNFTILLEPMNPDMKSNGSYKDGISPKLWQYDTPYLLVKEICYEHRKHIPELISLSDKVILLYRINKKEQLESWLNANETNNWNMEWDSNNVKITDEIIKTNYFNNTMNLFENDYLKKDVFFKISYEDLYYKDGFKRVLEYLNIDELNNKPFPYNRKLKKSYEYKKII